MIQGSGIREQGSEIGNRGSGIGDRGSGLRKSGDDHRANRKSDRDAADDQRYAQTALQIFLGERESLQLLRHLLHHTRRLN